MAMKRGVGAMGAVTGELREGLSGSGSGSSGSSGGGSGSGSSGGSGGGSGSGGDTERRSKKKFLQSTLTPAQPHTFS